MYFSRARFRSLTVAALFVLAYACGCRRPGPGGVTRLAILPVENLSGDRALDWVSTAAPDILSSQLAAAPELRAVGTAALRDAYAMRAGQVLHGYLTAAGERLRVTFVLEDLTRNVALRTIVSTGAGKDGVLPLFDQAARALSGKCRPYPTGSEEAVRIAATAAGAGDYQRAAALDPGFGSAYIAWARWLGARGERDEALKVLAAAQSQGPRIAPIERAEIAVMSATLGGDQPSRLRALAELAALTPSDAQPARSLGQLEFAAWRFDAALEWYRRAIAIEPDNADLRNMLAYAQAYSGDFAAARKSLAEYSRLAPDDPNAPDSLGEIGFLAGDFAAAEKGFLDAHRMNAAWRAGGTLLKAAHARVMTGDVAGADGLHSQYLELRKTLNDPLIPYRQAQWEFLTGRRRQALERLESFRAAASDADLAAHAAAQLAVWKRQTGDRAGARQSALEAERRGTQPATRTLAAIVAFVTEPAAGASEWAVRAERAFPRSSDTAARQYALAYALLVDGHFREASVLLRQMLRQSLPSLAGDLRTLAAWALVESGQAVEARVPGGFYPLPGTLGEETFASLAMPRVLLIHALLAEQGGRAEEAARLRAVYEKLKGDIPDAR